MQLNRVFRMMLAITERCVGPDLVSGPRFTRKAVRRQAATLHELHRSGSVRTFASYCRGAGLLRPFLRARPAISKAAARQTRSRPNGGRTPVSVAENQPEPSVSLPPVLESPVLSAPWPAAPARPRHRPPAPPAKSGGDGYCGTPATTPRSAGADRQPGARRLNSAGSMQFDVGPPLVGWPFSQWTVARRQAPALHTIWCRRHHSQGVVQHESDSEHCSS